MSVYHQSGLFTSDVLRIDRTVKKIIRRMTGPGGPVKCCYSEKSERMRPGTSLNAAMAGLHQKGA